jgi:hypothetical protein
VVPADPPSIFPTAAPELGFDACGDGQTVALATFQTFTPTGTNSGTVTGAYGYQIYASATTNGALVSSTTYTDWSGFYSLPVVDGTWEVRLDSPWVDHKTVEVSGSATLDFAASYRPHHGHGHEGRPPVPRRGSSRLWLLVQLQCCGDDGCQWPL